MSVIKPLSGISLNRSILRMSLRVTPSLEKSPWGDKCGMCYSVQDQDFGVEDVAEGEFVEDVLEELVDLVVVLGLHFALEATEIWYARECTRRACSWSCSRGCLS